jgi:AcrR family transcriptional regulator
MEIGYPVPVSAPPGRRERKKQLTRQAISDVATALFLEHGFDDVTVARIAAAADVAVQTVFNHFPTKEDLFFDDRTWVLGPAAAVRAEPDRPVAEVLEAHYRDELARRRDRGYLPTVVRFTETIAASPALRARRAHLSTEMREDLAAAVAGGAPDWHSRLVAGLFAAVTDVLDGELVRRLAGDSPDAVLDGLSPDITAAFTALRWPPRP